VRVVTRHREEPRTFTYEADEIRATYTSRPRRADLPERAAFFATEARRLEAAAAAALAAHHARLFCPADGHYSIDEASRCLYANPSPPPGVTPALAAELGEDAALFVAGAHAR
jgi:hypothetical protein